uniref:VapC9 PIN-like domain-containing protein n=1 Tax=Ignisphaera aggregans TaxID=334771 RepID=A0A7C5UUP4_9CREN
MEISWMGASSRLDKLNCIAVVDTSIILLISLKEASLDDLINLIPSCNIAILTPILDELKAIASKNNTKKSYIAKWALENLLKFFSIIEISVSKQKDVDDIIIEFVDSIKNTKKTLIVTADLELKKKALERGINVIWYRKERRGFEILVNEL